jgi:integrase
MLKFSARRATAAPAPEPVFDRRGYYRSPVTLPSYRRGRSPANAGRTFPAEVLTPDEVYALINACGRGPAGRRNRALIMTYWRAGLRCSEALKLHPKDIDLERGLITVLHGKGDKRRVVAIDPGATAVLQRWADERRGLGLTGREPFYCVISRPTVGQPLHASYVRELLKRLAVRAGVEKRVHAHGLRHSYASYLASRPEVSLHSIQTMLGHSSLAVTDRYIHQLSPHRELEQIRGLPWPEPTSPQSSPAGPPPPPR